MNRNGNKSVLIKQLMDALVKNVPFVENMTNEIIENLAGDTFHGGAHWTMIDQYGDVIEEDKRDLIEGNFFLIQKHLIIIIGGILMGLVQGRVIT